MNTLEQISQADGDIEKLLPWHDANS
jgi:hypothetical protein